MPTAWSSRPGSPRSATRSESGTVDDEGLLGFGRIPPGEGYRVVGGTDADPTVSEPVDVLARDDAPDQAFFDDQVLEEGVNYIEMRDGTTLAATVRFPSFPRDDVPADGPYPTVDQHVGLLPRQPLQPAIRAPAGRRPRATPPSA